MGGGATGGATDLHLRYHIATNTWDTMAPVPYKAQQPAGAAVQGKIHFFGGGYPNSGTRLNKHYVYDPDSNKWSLAASLPVARAIHIGISLDNKLLNLTGQPDKTLFEIYHPDSDKWETKNPLPDQNFWYGGIANAGEEIYRFGGGAYFAPVSSAHHYNKANDTWESLPDFPEASHGIAAVGYGDSAVYIAGGYSNNKESDKVWIYNVKKKIYHTGVPLPEARNYHNMVKSGNCIYSVGGNSGANPDMGHSLLRFCPHNAPLAVNDAKSNEKPLKITGGNGTIRIHFIQQVLASPAQVSVFDIAGRLVLSKELAADHTGMTELDAEHLGDAYYIIRVRVNDQVYTDKWVAGAYR
jgi:N-acetylneuraminic acid mutarotase